MKRAVLLVLLVMMSGFAYSVTDSEVGSWLKSHEEDGYTFLKTVTKGKMWKVSFKLPGWSQTWTVYVTVGKNENNPKFDIVTLFGGVADFEEPLSADLKDYILDQNATDTDWGFFSAYYSKSDKVYYVDYNIHIRKKFITSTALINAVGWVAGTCESYSSIVKKKQNK